MGVLSAKLRSVGSAIGGKGFVHWCPGCDGAHVIWTERNEGSFRPIWSWDGNVDAPTVTPSVRNFTTNGRDGKPLPDGQERTLCHYFLKAGNIEFCGDCEHALSGKTVPLPDFPVGVWGG